MSRRPHGGAGAALLFVCTFASLAGLVAAQEPMPGNETELAAALTRGKQTFEQGVARKAELAHQLASLPEAQSALAQSLARDVRALYRLRRGGLLPLAGGVEALVTHASRVAHLERMAQRTLRELDQARKKGTTLAKEVAQLDEELSATEQKLQRLEQARANLVAEAAARAAVEAQAQAAARAERQSDTSAQVSYGLTVVGSGNGASQLESLSTQRGRLALPVAGAAGIQNVAAEDGGLSKGLIFEGRPSASVRAAANGRVLSVERAEGGVLVTLEHGGGYRTLYGGLAGSDVEVGDSVSKSARVGSTGNGPVLFEVRRGSRSLDARSFLGL